MINIIDKSKCCGCNACVQKCPKSCITMSADEEGFWFPKVNLTKCIDCGLCEKVCPFLDETIKRIPLKTFGVKNKNTERRLNSSSGGLFSVLAEYVLTNNGVVCGAAYNDSYEVVHTIIESDSQIDSLIGSKYVQSNIGDTYKKAEINLKNGQLLLFTGTPCQIKGLKKFLRKDYNNLITVEIVCHGVPSPYIWQQFLSSLRINTDTVGDINFRAKQSEGYNWNQYGLVIKDKKGCLLFSQESRSTVYFQLFLSDLISRPSCYDCKAKNGSSGADITIGDFWGAQTILPNFFDDAGVSLMMIHSKRGYELFNDIKDKIDFSESEFKIAVSHNPAYVSSVTKPKEREKFWKKYLKTNDLEYSLKKAVYPPYIVMALSSIKHRCVKLFKR